MIIQYVSDLHLDISGYLDLPGGDVLILAGDICEVKELRKEFHQTKVLDREPGAFPCYDFFHSIVPKYKKVFMVIGNHEHYRGRFDKTYDELKSMLPDNVTLLEKECFEYEGVLFLGATLWTDLNKGDPITVYTIKNFMNDYKVIQNFYADKGLYHKLTPEHTISEHRKTKEYFKFVLEENRAKKNLPVVVITHMAPSFQSVNEKFKHETTTNGGYASELSEFILDNPEIKVWIHGHMHDGVDYMIGDTRVVANPRGYVPWEGDLFQPGQYFEV
jgi:Icc-related predicted phosphoesterase